MMPTDEQVAELRAWASFWAEDGNSALGDPEGIAPATLALLDDHARLRAFEDAMWEMRTRCLADDDNAATESFFTAVCEALAALDAARKGGG